MRGDRIRYRAAGADDLAAVVGASLTRWVELRGMTSRGLAAAARLTPATVHRTLHGERDVTLAELVALTAALDVALDDVLDEAAPFVTFDPPMKG